MNLSSKRAMRGMFWVVDEKAFLRLKAAAPDKDVLGETYGMWWTASTRVFNRASRMGEPRVQVNVSMNAFLFWCQQSGNVPDEAGRDAFAQIELARLGRTATAEVAEVAEN